MHPQQLETEKPLCISGPNAVFFLMLNVMPCHNEGGANMFVTTTSPAWCGHGWLDGSVGLESRGLIVEMQLLLCILL